MNPLRIAISGCTGRMGTEIIRLAVADPALRIVAAVTRAADPRLGQDAGAAAGIDPLELPVATHCVAACDVLIDFSLPAGCRQWAAWCASHEVALVSGTTGLDEADHAALAVCAEKVPVLWAPNMSVGVNLLLRLVADAAAVVGKDWDIEIVEAHHRHKIDAPSGTARALLDAIREARGDDSPPAVMHGRSGQCGPRRPGEIGIHAVRLGDVVGEHEVHLAGEGETLTLRHRAHSRKTFAAGALRAAKWLYGRPAGLHTMRNVLGGESQRPG